MRFRSRVPCTQFSTFNLDIPVLLHYQFGKRLYAGVGVQFSYLLIAEQSTTGRVVTGEQSYRPRGH